MQGEAVNLLSFLRRRTNAHDNSQLERCFNATVTLYGSDGWPVEGSPWVALNLYTPYYEGLVRNLRSIEGILISCQPDHSIILNTVDQIDSTLIQRVRNCVLSAEETALMG